jgi:hypothetical protein
MTYYILLPVVRAALPAAGGEGFHIVPGRKIDGLRDMVQSLMHK